VSTDVRAATALRVGLEYVGQIIWPGTLSADYWSTAVPLARGPAAPGTLAACAVIAAAALIVWRTWRRAPAIAFGLLLFGITLFPVSNIPFPIGVMKAERLMYTPSAGLLIAAGAALSIALSRPRLATPVWVGVALLALALSVRTFARNRDWQTNEALARATLAVYPDSPMMNTNLGAWYRDRGDLATARQFVERAAAAEPLNGHPWATLGDLAFREGRLGDAIALFEKALRLSPEIVPTQISLAQAYFRAERWTDAARVLERVLVLRPNRRASYVNLAGAYVNAGDATNALRIAEEGMRRFPDKGSMYAVAATAHEMLGHTAEAQRCRARADELGIETHEDE
jgi:tetratricopeptide (TPR) repeat protein